MVPNTWWFLITIYIYELASYGYSYIEIAIAIYSLYSYIFASIYIVPEDFDMSNKCGS